MKDIYYGVGRYTVVGPYHPDEIGARSRAMYTLRPHGEQVYEIRATSYEDARRKLLIEVTK